MSKLIFFLYLLPLLVLIESKPADIQTNQTVEAQNDNKTAETSLSEVLSNVSLNPFSPGFKWTNANIAAVTSATVVMIAGLALLTTIFFPMYVYKLCYALGGCQNTMDQYVDRFLGVQGRTRKIKRREIRETNDNMEMALQFLKMAVDSYSTKKEAESTVMSLTTPSSGTDNDNLKNIRKRSLIDYIAPILELASRAYNEFLDSDLKKNFNKLPFIR